MLSDNSIKELEKRYRSKGYGEFKKDLAEVIKNFLIEFQQKFNSISDKDVKNILREGAEKVRPIAEETLKRVKQRIGVL